MFKKITIVIVALGTSLPGTAQTTFGSLEDVWKYADEHNVTIRTAQYEKDKARYAKLQSYSALLPQSTITGSYTDNLSIQTTLIPSEIFGGPPGTYRPVQFGQKYIYAGAISAQWDILSAQNWLNVQIAKNTEAYNEASLANTRKTVYQQIATQYYSYLLMQEAARLADQNVRITDSVLAAAKNKFSEGTINAANLDIAKINNARSQQTQINAQYQMRTAKNNLKALLGMNVTDSIIFTSTLRDNTRTISDGTFTPDPSIRLAYTQAQISLGQYKAGKGTFLPTLSVLYNNSRQQNNNEFEPFTNSVPWFPARYWSLRASWNLFNGGARYFQAKRNKLTYDENMMQYEQAQKQAAVNDENIKLAYERSMAVLGKTEDVMKLSYDNYTHLSNRYAAGIESIENRLNAFKDYIDYQNQYLNSLSDMLVQLYQVKIRQQSF